MKRVVTITITAEKDDTEPEFTAKIEICPPFKKGETSYSAMLTDEILDTLRQGGASEDVSMDGRPIPAGQKVRFSRP